MVAIPGPALFDFRQVRYTFARKPGAILRCARVMLGPSWSDILRVMKESGAPISISRYKAIEGDLEGRNIAAVEWWMLCQCLGLCADSFSMGYSARWHLMKVRREVDRGEYRLPLSPILQARLAAFEESEALLQKEESLALQVGMTFQVQSKRRNNAATHDWNGVI